MNYDERVESSGTAAYDKKRPVYDCIKRLFDIVASACALVVLSPVFLIVAIAVKAQDGGDVLFIQNRCTKGGKEFRMYKFRSMCMDAEAQLHKVRCYNEMSGPAFKMKDDPRITKVGHFIRHTSLDELPQLVNVLRGDMSIVGPRPPLPREVEQYNAYQMHRLDVKSGLACYHECMGRNLIKDFDQWVEMDLWYIRERGLWTDAKIILKTIGAVITRKGAE